MHINEEQVRLGIYHNFNATTQRIETYYSDDLDSIRIKNSSFRLNFPVEVSMTAARHQTTGRKHSGLKLRTKTSQLVACSKRQKHCVRVEPVAKACEYCDSVNLTFRKILL